MLTPPTGAVVWVAGALLAGWAVRVAVRGWRTRTELAPRFFEPLAVVGGVLLLIAFGLWACAPRVDGWAYGVNIGPPLTELHGAAAAFGALAVLLGAFGWFGDSSRGRRRCPRCWYDMDAVAATGRVTCPECGRRARTVAELSRTKRWYGAMITSAALLVASAATSWISAVQGDGFRGAVPTTVVIAGLWSWPEDWWAYRTYSIADRVSGGLYGWQRWWLERRVRNELARPVSMRRLDAAETLAGYLCLERDPSWTSAQLDCCIRALASADPADRVRAVVREAELRLRPHLKPEEITEIARANADAALAAMHDPDSHVRALAIRTLAASAMHVDEVLRFIESSQSKGIDVYVREAMAFALAAAAADHPEAEAKLLRWTRWEAEHGYAAWRGIFASTAFVTPTPAIAARADEELLVTTDPGVAVMIAEFRLAGPDADPELARRFAKEASLPGPRRHAAIWALLAHGHPIAGTLMPDVLLACASDRELGDVVLREVCERLERPNPDPKLIAALAKLREHPEQYVFLGASRAWSRLAAMYPELPFPPAPIRAPKPAPAPEP